MDQREVGIWVRGLIEDDKLHDFYVSSQWLPLRSEVLDDHKNECQICKKNGSYRKATHVHHIQHVRQHPELALSKTYMHNGKEYQNLVSVCKECHETVCHPERLRWNTKKPLTEERW